MEVTAYCWAKQGKNNEVNKETRSIFFINEVLTPKYKTIIAKIAMRKQYIILKNKNCGNKSAAFVTVLFMLLIEQFQSVHR